MSTKFMVIAARQGQTGKPFGTVIDGLGALAEYLRDHPGSSVTVLNGVLQGKVFTHEPTAKP